MRCRGAPRLPVPSVTLDILAFGRRAGVAATQVVEGSGITRSTSFGDQLRSMRRAASLSQEELAQRAGISVKAIGALERGERLRPYPNTVRALAVALGLSEEGRAALLGSVPRRRSVGPRVLGGPARTDRRHPRRAQDGERQAAAWEIYVELVTRIAVVELGSSQGMLREALASLHSLFDTTRAILRRHGPVVAHAAGDQPSGVGSVAMTILNDVLRPVLSEWHPLLLDHESRRPAGVPAAEHERAWARNAELREVLARARARLDDHASLLAASAGVPHPLVAARMDAAVRH
jgi:transcriptional regulator with XRE-family HTH domain